MNVKKGIQLLLLLAIHRHTTESVGKPLLWAQWFKRYDQSREAIKNKKKTVILLYGRALKCAIGGKRTKESIVCRLIYFVDT